MSLKMRYQWDNRCEQYGRTVLIYQCVKSARIRLISDTLLIEQIQIRLIFVTDDTLNFSMTAGTIHERKYLYDVQLI